MSTKSPKVSQSLVSLMRRLRALLGSDVKRISPVEYLVAGRALVHLNYRCRFSTDQEKAEMYRSCHPSSISVSPSTEEFSKQLYGNDWHVVNPSAIYRKRTIQKRRSDGEINLESVAVAVTACVEAFDKFLERRKKQEARDKAIEEGSKTRMNALRKLFPGRFQQVWKTGIRSIKPRDSKHKVEVVVYPPDNEEELDDFTYGVEFKNINNAQLMILSNMILAFTQDSILEVKDAKEGNAGGVEGGEGSQATG